VTNEAGGESGLSMTHLHWLPSRQAEQTTNISFNVNITSVLGKTDQEFWLENSAVNVWYFFITS
jgi:hypothetical protein